MAPYKYKSPDALGGGADAVSQSGCSPRFGQTLARPGAYLGIYLDIYWDRASSARLVMSSTEPTPLILRHCGAAASPVAAHLP
jgi:hypothetical protein